jgi:hypothetical protein
MKNFINSFSTKVAAVLILLTGFSLSSCDKDKLNPEPLTFFSDLAVFSDPSRIAQQVNGLYTSMKSGQYLGGRFFVYQDIRGEEFLNETTNGVTGLQTWNFTLTDGTNEVNNLWNAVYYAINSCNLFIEGMEANKAALGNDALANSYIAEARFLRAVAYHNILTLYSRPFTDGNGSKAGVPLRLKAEKGADGNDLARASVAQVYEQILADLNFAEANLPTNYTTPFLNVTRAHKNTATAYKVRVLLAQGRYADVVTEANKIVPAAAPFKAGSGVAHELQADITNVFKTPYTTTESIFSMPFTENNLPGTQNGLGSYYNPGPRGIGDFSLNPNAIIGNAAFAANDARRAWVFTNPGNNKPYLNKFPTGPQHLDYAPVLRYSEVLLNLSEAIARTAGVNQRAVDLLNAVRGRSNPTGTYTTASFANANELIEAILTERRIELIGEGFRSMDIMRLGQTFPAKAAVPAVPPSSNTYIWPIPSGELAANPLCEPNP